MWFYNFILFFGDCGKCSGHWKQDLALHHISSFLFVLFCLTQCLMKLLSCKAGLLIRLSQPSRGLVLEVYISMCGQGFLLMNSLFSKSRLHITYVPVDLELFDYSYSTQSTLFYQTETIVSDITVTERFVSSLGLCFA